MFKQSTSLHTWFSPLWQYKRREAFAPQSAEQLCHCGQRPCKKVSHAGLQQSAAKVTVSLSLSLAHSQVKGRTL